MILSSAECTFSGCALLLEGNIPSNPLQPQVYLLTNVALVVSPATYFSGVDFSFSL